MAELRSPIVGVFDEPANADRAVEQLRSAGLSDNQIHWFEKTSGWDLVHLFTGRKGKPEALEQDLTDMGISRKEAQYYEREYKAGRTIVTVHPGDRRQQAMSILNSNGAYNYSTRQGTTQTSGSAGPRAPGAITPGMRPDDSSQTGIAITADGTQAARVDPAAVEADLEHVQKVFEEKYKD